MTNYYIINNKCILKQEGVEG